MSEIETFQQKNRDNLKDIFGYDDFRSLQGKVTTSVVMGNDTLVLMQTGGGKSLCFQIPATTIKQSRNGRGLCIVISPLKALIRDQVHDINATGKLVARYLIADDRDNVTESTHGETFEMLSAGKLDFLYLAPERLEKDERGFNRVIDVLLANNIPVNMVVFDEAHYTLNATEDFRSSYLRLESLIEDFPDAVRVSLTATADIHAQREIIKRTGLRSPKIYVDADYSRNHSVNITLDSGEKAKRDETMFSIISPLRQRCGIVYASRKKRLKELYELYGETFPSDNHWYYDGDTPQNIRMTVEDEYLVASSGVIFATNAFGMGVNKSDIYYVYHDGAPRSVSDFIQEIGRAGRDRSISSSSYAFMSYGDLAKLFTFERDTKSLVAKKRYAALVNVVMSTKCRNVLLAESLGVHAETCGICDNCNRPPETINHEDADKDSLLVLELLSEVMTKKKKVTRSHIADIVRGINSGKGKQDGWEFLKSFGKSGGGRQKNYWDNIVFYLIGRGLIEFFNQEIENDGYTQTVSYVGLTADGRKVLRSKDIDTETYPLRTPAEGRPEAKSRVTGRRLKESAPQYMHDMMAEMQKLSDELAEDADLEDVKVINDDDLISIVETGILNEETVKVHPMIDFKKFSDDTKRIIETYYPKKEEGGDSMTMDW